MRLVRLPRAFLCLLLGISCLAPSWSNQIPDAGHFHVLLIGVGTYNPGQEAFRKLTGDKDMDDLEGVLRAKYPSADIVKLNKTSEPTKGAILAAFDALTKRCSKGDAVYVAFAGHGTQIPDLGQTTRLSQAFAPYDVKIEPRDDPARKVKAGDVVASSVLTGPEIGALVRTLRDKVVDASGNANITLSFDSCNSGSITRGRLISRAYQNNAAIRALAQPGAVQVPLSKQPGVQGLVVLSAAHADQEAWESPVGGGVFTNALVESLRELDPKTEPHGYQTLFRMVQAKMAEVVSSEPQNPELLGGNSDREVFGTKALDVKNSFDVVVTPEKDAPGILHVMVKAGAAFGLHDGDVLGIYEPGVEDITKQPIAKGTLASCTSTSAEWIPLTKMLNSDKFKLGGKVALVLDSAPSGRLSVKFDVSPPAGVLEGLATQPYLRIVKSGEADVEVRGPNSSQPAWQVLGPDSMEASIASDQFAGSIGSILRQRSCFKSIHDLGSSVSTPAVVVEMRILLAKVEPGNSNFIALAQDPNVKLSRPLKSTESFIIQVRATRKSGTGNPCVAILNGVPSGKVTQLWPSNDSKNVSASHVPPSDHTLIADGKWRTLGENSRLLDDFLTNKSNVGTFGFSDGDGAGAQFFKVVATPEAVDYHTFLTDAGLARGGGQPTNRLADLFANYSLGETRSGPKKVSDTWSVTQLVIQFSDK